MATERETADNAMLLLGEALHNAEEHAHKNNPSKKTRIYSTLFSDRIYLSVQCGGDGYDPHTVRTSPLNDDGTVYVGFRGRGHIVMIGTSDTLFERDKGRELYAIIGRKKV
jgi:anti-sigma regulatory factor (Ser/Thr protein kinase)